MDPHTNALIHESSPYLLQHAHNPVNWYPWGDKALQKAKAEKKLLIISIGYAACHWCHVMEQESFMDAKVAAAMNEYFVAIKVDREERPDIDQIYMNAAQVQTGRGGWPLNVIALPDGKPLFCGTYFSKLQWLSLLHQIVRHVNENPDQAEDQANALTDAVRKSELVRPFGDEHAFSLEDLHRMAFSWEKYFDWQYGGHKGAPKFPLPVGYQFLLHYAYLTDNGTALDMVKITLDRMADGGIYDQAGGGFARYSTDAHWKIPHFEKMLYDNAQLVSLYSMAWQQTKIPRYKQIVYQTLGFINRELSSEEGGFYSSLDADSEGEEGKYYAWTREEIINILGDEASLVMDYYTIQKEGNWGRNRNILHKTLPGKEIAVKYTMSEETVEERVSAANERLLEERLKRVPPGLDDKILTSWNALMLKGYVDAYKAFGEKEFLDVAQRNAGFILKNLISREHRMNRSYKNGNASINAFLDDYAFAIEALIALYQATFTEKYLIEARYLLDYAMNHYYDQESGMFFYTSDLDPPQIARKMEITDNVIPSSNSQMAKNLFMLGHFFQNDTYIQSAGKMLNTVREKAMTGETYYANWDILMAWFASEPYEVVIMGEDFADFQKEISRHYFPDVFLSGGNKEGRLPLLKGKLIPGKTMIYVCRDKTCKLPVETVDEAIRQIRG